MNGYVPPEFSHNFIAGSIDDTNFELYKTPREMRKFKKILIRAALTLVIIVPVSAFAHFLLFPQQTRSLLIDYSGFKKDGRLYFDSNTPASSADYVRGVIELASGRVASFWGEKTSDPKFIYCSSGADFKKYGSPFPVPALTHIKFGATIVISNQGVDTDILAHEISHAEFYERIGFYNWSFKIPRWFDEGLAMLNDYRSYYSEDTLKARSDNFKNLPDVKQFKTGKQFNEEGSPEQIMLNFMTAKYLVKRWYTKEKLQKLIENINAGMDFDKAFQQ